MKKDIIDLTPYTFRVFWSPEELRWIAQCEQMPRKFFLDKNPSEALTYLMHMIWERLADLEHDPH